jgi:hypothetical protein
MKQYLLLALALCLTACGGGGGGSDSVEFVGGRYSGVAVPFADTCGGAQNTAVDWMVNQNGDRVSVSVGNQSIVYNGISSGNSFTVEGPLTINGCRVDHFIMVDGITPTSGYALIDQEVTCPAGRCFISYEAALTRQ